MIHNTPDYWQKLTPQQQLNDAVHKLAQRLNVPYSEAWHIFEREYNKNFGEDLSSLRNEYFKRFGTRPTTPAFLCFTNNIQKAVGLALTL
jgi:hypothetical protein